MKKKWDSLDRAVDAKGSTSDFFRSKTRDAQAAERFFRQALRATHTAPPRVMTVDKNAADPPACETLQQKGQLPARCTLRHGKYCKNVIEQDQRFVKRRVNPGWGLGSFRTAGRTLQGYEAMPMIKKGQLKGIAKGEVLAQNRVIAQVCGLVVEAAVEGTRSS